MGIESSLSIALQHEIPGNKVVCDLIEEARLIKTDYEIGRIACGECEKACTFKAIEPGEPYRIIGSRRDECGNCF